MRQNNHLSDLPELALRVEERQAGCFFWVLLAAGDPDHSGNMTEALYYRRYRTASEPQTVYWNALLLGMAELRRVLATDASNRRAKSLALAQRQRAM